MNYNPFQRLTGVMSPDTEDESRDTIALAAAMPRQRLLKTHLSLGMLPSGIMEKKKAKVNGEEPLKLEEDYFNFFPFPGHLRNPQPTRRVLLLLQPLEDL